MWKEVITFTIISLCTSQIFSYPTIEFIGFGTSKKNLLYEYSMHPNYEGESELCLAPPKTGDSWFIPSVEIKINSITSFHQIGEFAKNSKQKESFKFVIEKLNPNYSFGGQGVFLMMFIPVILFIFSWGIVVVRSLITLHYYWIKCMVYLWICIKQNIERREHTKVLIVSIILNLIIYALVILLLFGLKPYTDYFFDQLDVDTYKVFFNLDSESKLCFPPKQLVHTLYTSLAEMKFNRANIFNQTGVPINIVQQRGQLDLSLRKFSFTSILIIRTLLTFIFVYVSVYGLNYTFELIKRVTNYSRHLKQKIDAEDLVVENFGSKPDLKSEITSSDEKIDIILTQSKVTNVD